MIKILLVDYNISSRKYVFDILKDANFEVKEAANGQEAINFLENEEFNLLITEVILPEINGYELCRWLKKNPQTQTIPVLIYSTIMEEFSQYWAKKQGADDCIEKPFNKNDFLKKIQNLLSKHNN